MREIVEFDRGRIYTGASWKTGEGNLSSRPSGVGTATGALVFRDTSPFQLRE